MFTRFKRKKIKNRMDEIELELRGNRKELERLNNNSDSVLDDESYDSDVYKNLLKKREELEAEMQSLLEALWALPYPK